MWSQSHLLFLQEMVSQNWTRTQYRTASWENIFCSYYSSKCHVNTWKSNKSTIGMKWIILLSWTGGYFQSKLNGVVFTVVSNFIAEDTSLKQLFSGQHIVKSSIQGWIKGLVSRMLWCIYENTSSPVKPRLSLTILWKKAYVNKTWKTNQICEN